MTNQEMALRLQRASPAKLEQIADGLQDLAFRSMTRGDLAEARIGEEMAAMLRAMAEGKRA